MSNESEAEHDETQDEPETVQGAADTADETETQEATDDAETEETETEPEGFQDGAFIRLDYTARTVEEGQLVDTTDTEVAEEEGVEDEQEFEPRTIVLGEGHIFPSVEDDIRGKEIGGTGSVVVEADEAFGEYDDDQVRTISKDKLPEDDRYPGAQVRVGDEEGYVETIIGGRARVDFNHPLAGDDIEYEYEIVDTVDDREEKANGLMEMFLDLDLHIWFQTDTVEEEQLVESEDDDEDDEDDEESEPEFETVEVEKESLYIESTPQLSMNQQWMMQKQQIGQQIMDLLDVDRIVIEEIIDGSGGMGMPGMMGGMGGMGGGDPDEIEEALEEADIDADELAEELE